MQENNLINTLEEKGYIKLKKVVDKSLIIQIKKKMIAVMRQYVEVNKNLNLDQQLDFCFDNITKQGGQLRSNIYKAISNLLELYNLASTKNFKNILKKLQFISPRQQGTSIFAIEPKIETFLTDIHQDVRNDFIGSYALNFWFPLSSGKNIGGLAVYESSHKLGPIKHNISKKTGYITVNRSIIKKFKYKQITNYEIGDLVIFNPMLIHHSIKNNGSKIRWTVAMCIDDVGRTNHLKKNLSPFNKNKYVTSMRNETLLKKKYS